MSLLGLQRYCLSLGGHCLSLDLALTVLVQLLSMGLG